MRITTVIYLIKTESLQFQMKQSIKKMTNIYIYIYIYIYIHIFAVFAPGSVLLP